MKFTATVFFLLLCWQSTCLAQSGNGLLPVRDADSAFVGKFELKNDFRFFYGGQGNNYSIGSSRDAETNLNGDLYKNTNDYVGAGITYGWLDGDLSFSVRSTTYLKEERSNLTQFKLGLSYTQRKFVLRGFFTESTGVIVSGSDNEFESTPSIHEKKIGVQITWLFNHSQYSYRAAIYQSEYQLKTAGSFLLRLDPFFRNLGRKEGSMIPETYDLPSRFGDQTGLEYVKAPGVLILPGYGMNIVIRNTRYFLSPIAFAGLGLAHNMYKGTNGKDSFTNAEFAANLILNAGYNGARYYSKVQVNWSTGYTSLKPTYLTSSNLTIVLTCGVRFADLF